MSATRNDEHNDQRKTQAEEEARRLRLTEYHMDQLLGNLLRLGVLAAAAVVILGGVPYILKYGAIHPVYKPFHGVPVELTSIRGILRTARAHESRAIVELGLLLLIATPVARVTFSLFAFAKQRDFKYVLITTFVLGVLLWSFTGGVQG